MLKIRQEQFAKLSLLEVQKFEDWMHVHVKRFFPSQCATLGDQELLATIQYGIKRAAAHGIRARRDVCKYIDLTILFGRDFDTNRQSRWASEILRRRAASSEKMQWLFWAAKHRLKDR